MAAYRKNYQASLSKIKLVIYTAIFGKKDSVQDVPLVPDADFYLFTDNKELKSNKWNVIYNDVSCANDPRRKSRFLKMMPHKLFPDYDYSLWIDGNLELIKDPSILIKKYLSENLSIAHTEPEYGSFRKSQNLYGEAELCIKTGKDESKILLDQIEFYRREGYPEESGLWRCSIILRKHHHEDSIRLNEMWWDQLIKYSCRDQVSFPYCVWKIQVPVVTIPEINEYILKHLHLY